MLGQMEHMGLLPLDLLALPVWRALTGMPRRDRAPMRLAMVRAWDRRFREPLHWAGVQRQAVHLVKSPGRQARPPGSRVAPWLENV
jgi:hypothetical protein